MTSFWRCWAESDDENVDQIKLELSDTREKLQEAKKEIARLKFEKITLINKTNVANTSDSLQQYEPTNTNYSRSIPNFEYSDATMIIHPDNTATQGSALEKLEEKVMEKFEKKTGIKYQILSETDNESNEEEEDLENLKEKHKQQINELMKELDRLTIRMQQTEDAKNKEIDALKNEITQLKEKLAEKQKSEIKTIMKTESFSKSVNQDIDSDDSDFADDDLQKENKKKSRQNHYDNTAEQIEILNNEILRNNSLQLLSEELDINGTGEDKGIILFIQKYVKSKTVNQIFNKSPNADADCIANATGLVNVLSFVTILYKVKVFHVKHGKSTKNKNPKIDNSQIKNTVKYLAIWIVRTYGEKSGEKYFDGETGKEYDVYNFKLSKHDFQKYMHQYLKEFVQNKAEHIDSQL